MTVRTNNRREYKLMPETTNETYHPMAFDAIKIGLASPEKIRSWTHRTPEPADKPSKQWKDWKERLKAQAYGCVLHPAPTSLTPITDIRSRNSRTMSL